MKKNTWLLVPLVLFTLHFASCDKDDGPIPEPPELITTLRYTLAPISGGNTVILEFRDIDGDGGIPPVVTGGTLAANESYDGSLTLLNESVTPVESITEEIKEEDDDHQFFFQSDIPNLTVAYNDVDDDGKPVGLSSVLSTGEAATGFIKVTLRHKPEKSASGVSEGDITNAIGETDIEVSFPVDVQ